MSPVTRGQISILSRPRKDRDLTPLAPLALLLIAAVAVSLSANQSAAPATPARELVNTYCISCHNERSKTANLLLDKADAERPGNSAETWEKVIVKLRSRSMPPPGGPRRPDNATYDRTAAWLES